jgi:cellulose 1,4-beta-cellobiosidase
MLGKLAALSALVAAASAQQVGKDAENHPKMTWQKCTRPGSCTTVNGEVVIDANWRWTHDVKSTTNCYDGNTWNESICKDAKSCASSCAIEGMRCRSG